MERPVPPLDAERLLAESGWVRPLVRRLVRDAGLAEDVVQDAWVTALERPPLEQAGAVWRAWLARVVRSRARERRESDRRRAQRERLAVDATATAPSAFEVVARTQLLQRVVAAVLELDEPYRSAVLWRFYDDLSAHEIARRHGTSAENARQRVARGLARLRQRLDREHGGDGRSWAVALAPLCRRGGGASATGPVLAGTLLMGKTTPLVLGLAVALSGVLLWRAFTGDAGARERAPVPGGAEPSEPLRSAAGAALDAPSPAGGRTLEPALAPAASAPATAWLVRARLVDSRRAPVAGATLALGELTAAAGADGAVELACAELPTFERDGERFLRAVASAPGRAPDVRIEPVPPPISPKDDADADGSRVLELGELCLVPIGALAGRVEDELGRPVAGAEVVLARPALGAAERADRAVLGPDFHGVVQRGTSDAAGRFLFEDVGPGTWRPWATGAGLLWSAGEPVRFDPALGADEVVLRLLAIGPENGLRGRVLASDGAPLAGAQVLVARAGEGDYRLSAESGADGRFALAVPRGEALVVTVLDPEQRHRPETRTDVVGGPEEQVFALVAARWTRLHPVDERGEPVHDALARVELRAPFRWEFHHAEADGRVRVLVPDRAFALHVQAEGHAPADLAFEPEAAPAELTLELPRLARLSGVVRDPYGAALPGALVQLVRVSDPHATTYIDGFPARLDGTELQGAYADADGRFALAIGQAGAYALYAEHPGFAAAELGPLELDPRRAAERDVVLTPGGAVEGRVLAPAGESPAGALVRLARGDMRVHEAVCDAEGRYHLERLTPGPYMVAVTRERRGAVLGFAASAVETVRTTEEFAFPWALEVRAGETTRKDLDLDDGGRGALVGQLRIDGVAPDGATARLVPADRPWTTSSFESPEVELSADGGFEFGELRPGGYTLVVTPVFGPLAGSELVQSLSIERGSQRCELELASARVFGALPAAARAEPGPFALVTEPAPGLRCVTPAEPGPAGLEPLTLPAGAGARLVGWRRGEPRDDPLRWPTLATFDLAPGALRRITDQ